MRFLDDQIREFESKNDPTTPKTRWGLRPLTFFDLQSIEKEAGSPPLRGLHLYLAASKPLDDSQDDPDHPPSDEVKQERLRIYLAKLAELSADEQVAVDQAREYLVRYNYAVCCRGVATIDGRAVDRDQCASMLSRMRPSEVFAAVVADVSNKIRDLDAGETEKKG